MSKSWYVFQAEQDEHQSMLSVVTKAVHWTMPCASKLINSSQLAIALVKFGVNGEVLNTQRQRRTMSSKMEL